MAARTEHRKRPDDRAVYTAGHLFGEWGPKLWKPRKGNFATARQSALAELVRGELIERLDAVLVAAVPVWEADFGLSAGQCYSLIQCVQLALFPDEFAEDERAAEDIARLIGDRQALVPKDGPVERVGWEAMEAYARSLGVEIEEESPPSDSVTISGVEFPASEAEVLRKRTG